jgi:4a-hydroxytetrahydrobiopterin dehydratase
MDDISNRHCEPIAAGTPALARAAVTEYLARVQGWALSESGAEIRREFRFKNYHETMAFVNAVAWIAHVEDHHPNLEVGYGRCLVSWSTHSVGGLSDNDFIAAAKVNALTPP